MRKQARQVKRGEETGKHAGEDGNSRLIRHDATGHDLEICVGHSRKIHGGHQSMLYSPWSLPRSWLYSPSLEATIRFQMRREDQVGLQREDQDLSNWFSESTLSTALTFHPLPLPSNLRPWPAMIPPTLH